MIWSCCDCSSSTKQTLVRWENKQDSFLFPWKTSCRYWIQSVFWGLKNKALMFGRGFFKWQAPCVKVRPGLYHLSPVVHSTFDPGNHLRSPCRPVWTRSVKLYLVKGLMRSNLCGRHSHPALLRWRDNIPIIMNFWKAASNISSNIWNIKNLTQGPLAFFFFSSLTFKSHPMIIISRYIGSLGSHSKHHLPMKA